MLWVRFPAMSSLLSDPRVRHGIEKVGQEIYCDVSEADGEDAALDYEIVAVANGVDGEASDAGPGEDFFGDDGAGK